MAATLKIESLPTCAADLKGTCSVSDFINEMPSKLSCSQNASITHLKLFWTQDDDVQDNNDKGLEEVMEKIKSAVKGLDIFLFPTLFQIWVPKTVDGRQFLVSSDLPFGISSLLKGLCSYRKECLDYKYSLDGDEDLGPVGRVFRNGFPEFSPHLRFYSTQEFKLRDYAESCGLYGYLALPVFQAEEKKCTSVLELITVFDGNHCMTNTLERVAQALQTVGLRTYNIHSLVDMERSSHHEVALTEIEKDLKAVCQAHNIPFAQTWFPSKGHNFTETVMCTSEKGSCMLQKRFSSFQKGCIKLGLKKGQGVVWRAFTSGNSWFCKDVSQLSIKDFPLVLSARKVGLTASFAICLKSLLDKDDVYVLEFFLPLKQKSYSKPSTHFVNSLLTTVLQHFKGFEVAIRQEQGMDGTIYSINCITDDERNAAIKKNEPDAAPNQSVVKASDIMVLKICSKRELETTDSVLDVNIPAGKQSEGKYGLDPPSKKRKADPPSLSQQDKEGIMDNGGSILIKASYKEDIILFPLSLSSGISDLVYEINKRLELASGSFEIKYQSKPDECIIVTSDSDLQNLMCNMVSEGKKNVRLVLQPVQDEQIAMSIDTSSSVSSDTAMTIEATYKEDAIKFELPFHSGLVELKGEILKQLKLKEDGFQIKYLAENNEQIPVECDADLQKCVMSARSLERQTLGFLLEPVSDDTPKEKATAAPLSAAGATEMQSGSKMIIKAVYEEDIVKFQISSSSGMAELKDEVTKRFKISGESFRVKYQDAAGDWSYISDDEQLQNYLSGMASNNSAVKFHIEPIMNEP